MLKKYLIILLAIIPFYKANASIIITHFDKQIKFTDYGDETVVKIKAKIELPNKNYFYNEWGYTFNPVEKIEMLEASVNNKKDNFSFKKNVLLFKFDNAFNGELLEFVFKYKRFIEDGESLKYIKKEYAFIPQFAKDAEGKLVVHIPEGWSLYSMHPSFTEDSVNRNYIWEGKVPEGGLVELFELTLEKAKWKISMKNTMVGPDMFKNLNLSVPIYFKGGNHIIEDYKVTTTPSNATLEANEEKGYITARFRQIRSRLAQVTVTAVIENGLDDYYWVHNLNPGSFTSIDISTSTSLSSIIQDIQNQRNANGTPEYIRIAKWVHDYLEYDETYIGKDMSIQRILEEKKGVCIHYSLLYEKLLRSIGIPATAVSGLSYNTDKNKFEEHSWVLTYINGEWTPIDPTWGIYSGKLPVSHIFLYKNTTTPVTFVIYDYKNTAGIQTDMSEEVIFLNHSNE